jgi:hypothetical protein
MILTHSLLPYILQSHGANALLAFIQQRCAGQKKLPLFCFWMKKRLSDLS